MCEGGFMRTMLFIFIIGTMLVSTLLAGLVDAASNKSLYKLFVGEPLKGFAVYEFSTKDKCEQYRKQNSLKCKCLPIDIEPDFDVDSDDDTEEKG
jgi:hypothetical protein